MWTARQKPDLSLHMNSGLLLCFPSEGLSEEDLLSQYSLSFPKKTKRNSCDSSKVPGSSRLCMPDLAEAAAVKKSLSAPPTARNKFAALLRRKNEESGAVVVPGTRSRYGRVSRMRSVCHVRYAIGAYLIALNKRGL